MAFESRTKDTNGVIHNSVAGIVAEDPGYANETEPGGMGGQWGPYGAADLVFWRATPLSDSASRLNNGKESGRALASGGWQFNGPIYRDTRVAVDPPNTNSTSVVLDVATNYFWHRTVYGTITVYLTNSTPRALAQQAVVVLKAPAGCNLNLPGWICMSDTGMMPLPTRLLPGETMLAELFLFPNAPTYARVSLGFK
jgi:hypothetical protein